MTKPTYQIDVFGHSAQIIPNLPLAATKELTIVSQTQFAANDLRQPLEYAFFQHTDTRTHIPTGLIPRVEASLTATGHAYTISHQIPMIGADETWLAKCVINQPGKITSRCQDNDPQTLWEFLSVATVNIFPRSTRFHMHWCACCMSVLA